MSEAMPYTLAEVTPYEVQCIDSLRLHATVVALDASRAETKAQRERAERAEARVEAMDKALEAHEKRESR